MRVFLTGASSGIGEALARLYGRRGATLGLAARNSAALDALAAGVDAPCHCYPLDVRDGPALRAAAADFIAHAGVPDVVIANAGISIGTDSSSAEDLSVFREVMDTNVLGIASSFQPFIDPMRGRGAGVLAGIASVAGYRGLPGSAAYSASKAAAISYLESVRVELRGSGVDVVTISPGYIGTPMTSGNPYPMPFIMTAEVAAEKIARLIDRRSAYAVIPWQMAIVARLMRVLPNPIYDRLFALAPRKPRQG